MKDLLCDVYKSGTTDALYLYVDRTEGLVRVPEALLSRFGKPTLALSLKLNVDRRLAKEDPVKVLEAIRKEGYFLQMPPQTFGLTT